MPSISANYPTGGIPNEDIAAAPGNEGYRRAFEEWQAGGARDFPPTASAEEWRRALEHDIAQRRAQPARPPLFFGGDPRTPHFLQTPVNPDPNRYYRIVESEEEAAAVLEQGDLPIVVSHSLLQRLPPTHAIMLVEEARVRQYERPLAPFRNAVELLRRGLPSRGAEEQLAPTIMPRYNRELDLNNLRNELPGLDAEQGIQRIRSIFRQTSQPTPQAPSSPAVAGPSIAANMPMPRNSARQGLIPLTPATMPSIIDAMARPTLPDVLSISQMSQDPPQS